MPMTSRNSPWPAHVTPDVFGDDRDTNDLTTKLILTQYRTTLEYYRRTPSQ